MKLNLILFSLLLALFGMSYFVLYKDAQQEINTGRRSQYLVPIDTMSSWTIKIPKGELSLKHKQFYWNDQIVIDIQDKKLRNIYTRLRDLKIIEQIGAGTKESWYPSDDTNIVFSFDSRDFQIGSLNTLTGRMKIRDSKSGDVFIIDDESTLEKPYKSFEQGQKIKYAKLKKAIETTQWK